MARSTSRSVASRPARVKTAICISPEAAKRLGAACIQEGMTQSELVEFMIGRLLSGYVISLRGQGIRSVSVTPTDRLDPTADVSLANSAVPA
jgi:hypothetical protein